MAFSNNLIANAGKVSSALLSSVSDAVKKAQQTTIAPQYSSVQINKTENESLGGATVEDAGEELDAENPLIQTEEIANNVAKWIADVVTNRVLMSGEYRADPRLDPLDKITVQNKYADSTMVVTEISYEYSGSFVGTYKGRVIE